MFTTRQRRCGKVMFFTHACLSIHWGGRGEVGGGHVTITITHDVLDLTVQGSPPLLTWDRMTPPLDMGSSCDPC